MDVLQERHSVAEWSDQMSLSGRLSLFVALIVIGVVASVAVLENRAYERLIDSDLENAARLAAQSAADTLADRAEPLDSLEVRDTLHDLLESAPIIDALSVISSDANGVARVVASTSSEERAEVAELAIRALRSGVVTRARSATVVTYALPVPRKAGYAVAATVGLESLIQARSRGLRLALGFAAATIVLVTLLVQFTVRQFVSVPVRGLLRTMDATGKGQWQARAPVLRNDELGVIASGLNAMLEQVEGFNQALRDRVEEATRDLSVRNAQLAASREALLSTRESLARAERVAALGQVAANVAHQAGTPLNLVSGYVQMLRDDPATDEPVRAKLETVDRQIQQVARVLRTMLDSARQPVGFETVTIGDVVERVREVAEPRLARSGITLEVRSDAGLPPIRANLTQLEMALLNLLTNALDAMPSGGTVTLTITATDGGIQIEVADTGPGISPDVIERLFELWVTTKPAGQGSGLGLAIVRDVVRAHGGAVSAYNRQTGAVFVIRLPAGHDVGRS